MSQPSTRRPDDGGAPRPTPGPGGPVPVPGPGPVGAMSSAPTATTPAPTPPRPAPPRTTATEVPGDGRPDAEIEGALHDLEESAHGEPAGQVAAAERVHELLQSRLSGVPRT